MLVLGLISGTSHDGVDACLVDFTQAGAALHGHVVAQAVVPYPDELRARLVAALPQHSVAMAEVCALDTLIGQHLAAVAVATVSGHEVDLICSHGQTVFHWVEGGRARGTLQLGQPAWVAELTGVPVLSDLRAADLAAGGQGAPLVSVLDTLLLGGRDGTVGALNLGGIANITVLPVGAEPYAYDLGPANALIDAAVVRLTDGRESFDRDGGYAARGRVDDGLLTALLADPYYALPHPKSTGKEVFHDRYLDEHLGGHVDGHEALTGVDVVATVTELTARIVSRELRRCRVEEVLVSGGGAANLTLMRRIAGCAPEVAVGTTDALGAPSDLKEAIAFALIGYLSAHGLPGNVPTCTGARGPRVLGTMTAAPARLAAVLAGPRVDAPHQLTLD